MKMFILLLWQLKKKDFKIQFTGCKKHSVKKKTSSFQSTQMIKQTKKNNCFPFNLNQSWRFVWKDMVVVWRIPESNIYFGWQCCKALKELKFERKNSPDFFLASAFSVMLRRTFILFLVHSIPWTLLPVSTMPVKGPGYQFFLFFISLCRVRLQPRSHLETQLK